MQQMSQIPNNQVSSEFLIELEKKHVAQALQEVEERKKAGLAVTPQWLEGLESKYMALAWQEIAAHILSQC